MKALVLRDDPAKAAQTAQMLTDLGVQILCASDRALAQALLRAGPVDLLVLDEKVAGRLTHALALSAERRNLLLCTIMLSDRCAEAGDDLFCLIPSLYALLGLACDAAVMRMIAAAAMARQPDAGARRAAVTGLPRWADLAVVANAKGRPERRPLQLGLAQ